VELLARTGSGSPLDANRFEARAEAQSVHFIDSWTELQALDLFRLLLPALLVTATMFVPGRPSSGPAAALVAISVVFLPELGPPPITFGWVALWLVVAWKVGERGAEGPETQAQRPGGAESGAVGLLLGSALLALLVAGVARQDLAPEDGRRASWGLVMLGLGLLHLMLRRHARRALVGFAAMGLGLQMLDGAARGSQIPGSAPLTGAVLLVTAVTVAVVARVAEGRERIAGSPWIADAHDLHD
jgi:hypothetical protein